MRQRHYFSFFSPSHLPSLSRRVFWLLVLALTVVLSGTPAAGPGASNSISPNATESFTLGVNPVSSTPVPHTALIYGPSVTVQANASAASATGPEPSCGAASNEECALIDMGYSVTVAPAATWQSMTQSQFAAYNLLVFGDPTCGSASVLNAAVANESTWAPIVNGPIIVLGTDPVYHYANGGKVGAGKLIWAGLNFAAGGSGTGLYLDLSCYYSSGTTFAQDAPILDGLESGFQVYSANSCAANISIVSPGLPGVTNADLSNWACSVHEYFGSWPSDFAPLALDTYVVGGSSGGASTDLCPMPYIASGGEVGCPYILGKTAALTTTNTSVSASAGTITPGDKVTFTATVSAGGTPTGLVTFFDGTTPLGSGFLNGVSGNDQAAFTTALLSAAGSPHAIKAVYQGDATFAGSASAATSVTVSLRSSATGVSLAPPTAVVGQTSTATVTVTSSGSVPPGVADTFASTGAPATGSTGFTATLFGDGLVLVAGGTNATGTVLQSAEVYTVSAAAFVATGNLNTARTGAVAVLLPSGKVLIAGGSSDGTATGALNSAELFDPNAGTFAATSHAMTAARLGATATLLGNGKVLLAGGENSGGVLNSAELYDSTTNTFTATGTLSAARTGAAATLLGTGKVLVAGGSSDGTATGALNSAEVFGPTTGTFTDSGWTLSVPRWQPGAALLLSGKVLVAGGQDSGGALTSADLYDPVGDTFLYSASTMAQARANGSAIALPNGMVLLAGGTTNPVVDLYDADSDRFDTTGSLAASDNGLVSTLLNNGQVLVVGLTSGTTSAADAELYSPSFNPLGTVSLSSSEATDTIGAACVLTPSTSTQSTCNSTVRPSALATSPHTITATYPADAVHSTSTNTGSLTVDPAATTVVAANQTTTYGATTQNVTLSASVTANAPSTATVSQGTVTFTVLQGGTTIGTPTTGNVISANASVSYSLPAGTAPGTYIIQAAYSGGSNFGPSTDSTHTLTVINTTPVITSASSATFTVGTAGSFTVTATGSPVPTFSESGALPSGITFSADGVLSGSPAAGMGGTYPITITATNGVSPNATQSFTLTVNQAPAISSGSSATFIVGSAGSFTATASGFPTPAFSETGALPSGITFSASGVLSGTPAAGAGGTYPITITASNGVSPSAMQSFTLTVNKATPVITWPSPAQIIYGTALSATQLNATASVAGTYSYSPAAGTVLSAGNNQTLSVTFTPNDTTDYTSATASVTLTVNPAPLTVMGNNVSRPYGAKNPAVTPTITGVVNGDAITAADTITAGPATPVGIYANGIVPSVSGAPANVLNNYAVSLVNGTLTVFQEPTLLAVSFSPVSIMVGQSTTATITLTAPDMVIPIDPSVLAAFTLTSPVASDILTNGGICTPVPSTTTAGVASCTVGVTSVEPDGRTLLASFPGSADLGASTSTSTNTGELIVTAALVSQPVCIASDFRNVAVPGGSIWFNSIFRVRDVKKQLLHLSFFNSNVQFQYTDPAGNVVVVNQKLPDADITIDPNASATSASTTFDPINNVWTTTLPWDTDDNAFLTGATWAVPSAGLPPDVEPVTWCGQFASDVANIDIGWRWAAAAYSTFSSDNTTLGVKPQDTDHDNPGTNRDLAGTPENYKQYVIPGARGKGGKNYTGSYSRSSVIE